jgi:vancomycin permeability regulator SanA
MIGWCGGAIEGRRGDSRRAIIAANCAGMPPRRNQDARARSNSQETTRAGTKPIAPIARRRPRWGLALVAVVGLDLLLVALYLLWAALSLPAPMPAATHAAGVAFFHSFGAQEGLSPESMARVEHARMLFQAGKVRWLVCVGGSRRDRPESGAALMAKALARRGVPPKRLRRDATSFDTIGNWRSAQALLGPSAAQDPLLISSPLHLLRIGHIAQGAGTPAPTHTTAEALRRRGGAIWLDVHREWLAWTAAALLPPDRYERWVRRWRDFWDNPAWSTRHSSQPPDDEHPRRLPWHPEPASAAIGKTSRPAQRFGPGRAAEADVGRHRRAAFRHRAGHGYAGHQLAH